jgi:hypothetical protein
MTSEQLAAIEARAKALEDARATLHDDSRPRATFKGDATRFVAAEATMLYHARTDIPALVAEVKRLREALTPFCDPNREVSRDDKAVLTVHVEVFAHEVEAARTALTPAQEDKHE